jgi:hypothetical protein
VINSFRSNPKNEDIQGHPRKTYSFLKTTRFYKMKKTTNNPNGRPKGVPNKSTSEVREFLKTFIENNLDCLQEEFDQLEGSDKFKAIEKILPYVLPKHNAISITKDESKGRNLPRWMTDYDEEEEKKTKIDLSKVPTEILEALLESQKDN